VEAVPEKGVPEKKLQDQENLVPKRPELISWEERFV